MATNAAFVKNNLDVDQIIDIMNEPRLQVMASVSSAFFSTSTLVSFTLRVLVSITSPFVMISSLPFASTPLSSAVVIKSCFVFCPLLASKSKLLGFGHLVHSVVLLTSPCRPSSVCLPLHRAILLFITPPTAPSRPSCHLYGIHGQ